MALLKLLLMLLPLLIQTCTAAPQFGVGQEVLSDDPVEISNIRKALKKSDIIPDVLDDFHPSFSVNVTYPRTHKAVKLGNTISPDDVQHPPDLRFRYTSHSSLHPTFRTYAFVLTDPDATSRSDPKLSEMCHWIVNATYNADADADASMRRFPSLLMPELDITAQVTELIKYLPPSPPPKTGKHRYVFILLAGPDGTELKKPTERPHWGYGKVRHGVRDWAEENGMVVVGANFFYAQNKKQ